MIYLKPADMADYQRHDSNGHRLWPKHIKNDQDKQEHMDRTAAFECPKCGGCVQAYSESVWRCLSCDFSNDNNNEL